MQPKNTDPDFAFLFLKANWQQAYKQLMRRPLDAKSVGDATSWLEQAKASPELLDFDRGFFSGPAADFDSLRAEVLAEVKQDSNAELRDQVNALTFFRENLAIFPELALKRIPALFFSETLISVLRQPTLDLRQMLHEAKKPKSYELEDLFFLSLSRKHAEEITKRLPIIFKKLDMPQDCPVFLQLTAACAAGTVEMLIHEP